MGGFHSPLQVLLFLALCFCIFILFYEYYIDVYIVLFWSPIHICEIYYFYIISLWMRLKVLGLIEYVGY